MGPINNPDYLITFEVDSLTHLLAQMVLTSLCSAPKITRVSLARLPQQEAAAGDRFYIRTLHRHNDASSPS